MKNFYRALLILLLPVFLSSCVAVVIGGAAAAGTATAVIYDKRNVNTIVQDEKISHDIEQRINANPKIAKQSHIIVSTYRGWVLLAGQTTNQQIKQNILDTVKTVPNIKRLYDEVTIGPPIDHIMRTNDVWITTKVKTKLLATKGLKSGQIKVTTEDGVVYLMGLVTKQQASLAADVAQNVSDVKEVMKIFEYPDESGQETQ